MRGRSRSETTYVARITTSKTFGELAAGLAGLGRVENLFIKGGNAEHTSAINGSKKKIYTPAALATFREAGQRKSREAHERKIATLADIMRNNAHAPLFKLAQLMNETEVRVNPRGQLWTEGNIQKYVEEALARITAPNAPEISG
jgi:hypothetical protein